MKKRRVHRFKIVVEKHHDGYVAYPLGLKGVVVGEGDAFEEALADVVSAIRFHIETFGEEVFEAKETIEAFTAEVGVPVSQRKLWEGEVPAEPSTPNEFGAQKKFVINHWLKPVAWF